MGRTRSLHFPGVGRLLGLCSLFSPIATAWACPSCAAREVSGPATGWLIGAMMLLPFGVAGVGAWVLGRVLRPPAERRKR